MRKLNEEVLFTEEPAVRLGRKDIEALKAKARRNARGRIRLCVHRGVQDKVHEMLIVMPKGAYVRPHKHLKNPESYHVVAGAAVQLLFDGRGRIVEAVPFGDYRSGRRFFYKMRQGRYHTLVVLSDALVFHETKAGPFRRSETVFPPWAPREDDALACARLVRRWTVKARSIW